jgi:hypothetical protein
LAVGITLISTKLTPEQTISKYNPMSEQSIKNDLRVLKTPTPGDNTFAYAINQAAAKGVQVADTRWTKRKSIDNSWSSAYSSTRQEWKS